MRFWGTTVGAGLLVAAALALALPAGAKDREVRVRGTCSAASTAKLKLSLEDGRIEVEFEVDQNRNGVVWNVVMQRGGRTFFRGRATTRPPSGSFEIRKLTRDMLGPDRISARGTSPGGEVCRARATI